MLFLFSELTQLLYLLKKHWKYNYLVGLLGLIVLAFIAGVTNIGHNADYVAYMNDYNISPHQGSADYHFEKGYTYLALFFYKLNFSYQQFRIIFACIAVAILFVGIYRFTRNVVLVTALYGLTVFVLDSVQIRNFMVLALVVLGSSFLIDGSAKNTMISIFFILLSGQFHSMGYLFLLVVLFRFIPEDVMLKKSWIFVVLSVLAVFIVNLLGVATIGKILASIVGLISDRASVITKITSQYSYGTVLISYTVLAIATICGFLLLTLIFKIISLNNDIDLTNRFKVLYAGGLVSVVMLPTLSLAGDYSRIPRAAFIFILLGIAIYYEYSDKLKITKMKSLITFFVILVCFMTAGAHFFSWGTAYRANVPYLLGIFK